MTRKLPNGSVWAADKRHGMVCVESKDQGAPKWDGDPLRFLLDHIESIRQDEAAGEIVRDVRRWRRRAEWAVDRHPSDVYAGRCDATIVVMETTWVDGVLTTPAATERFCGGELLAPMGSRTVTCWTCGARYDFAERREAIERSAANVLLRPPKLADAMAAFGKPIKLSTLEDWIKRDRKRHRRQQCNCGGLSGCLPSSRWPAHPILADPVLDDEGHALYRVGDVIARWVEVQAEKLEDAG